METWKKSDLRGKPSWSSAPGGLNPVSRPGDSARFSRYCDRQVKAIEKAQRSAANYLHANPDNEVPSWIFAGRTERQAWEDREHLEGWKRLRDEARGGAEQIEQASLFEAQSDAA